LNQLHELAFLFNEIKNNLPSFIKLFNLLKRNKMLGEELISKLLRYANQDLSSLENKIQKLTGDVTDLEWKKKQSQDIIEILNSSMSELRRTLNSYDMTTGLRKLILADLDAKMNQKLCSLRENGSAMKQA
jgi:chromosome segregation ATPase